MVQAHPDHQRRAPQPRELRGPQFHRVRILLGRGRLSTSTRSPPTASTRDFRSVEVVADRDSLRAAAGPGATQARERQDEHSGHMHYFLVKIDFGIMQCTPLRTSTTCETRQSPTIDTSE